MSAPTSSSAHDRWCDVEGRPIALFSEVEQVAESMEPGVLPSRLHQRGQVVGRGDDALLVAFDGGQVISVSPRLLRLLPDARRVPGSHCAVDASPPGAERR